MTDSEEPKHKIENSEKIIDVDRTKIFLIGGGLMRLGQTESIDQWLVENAPRNKQVPNVLLVPAAGGDRSEYIEDFTRRYTTLGAQVDTLFLIQKVPSFEIIRRKVDNADVIYIGAGDPDLLLRTLITYNMVERLRQATLRGTLIVGISAGAAIFGKNFLTFKIEKPSGAFTNFRVGRGLGWLNAFVIVHYHPKLLKDNFVQSLLPVESKILTLAECTMVNFNKDGNPLVVPTTQKAR